jgi:hypothetical protein
MSAIAVEPKAKPAQPPSSPGAPFVEVASQYGRRPAPNPRASITDPEAARARVISVIVRIEGHLDEETAALNKSLKFDFKASNDRKSQGLVDLNQALKRLQRADVTPDLQLRLKAFREKLAVNLRRIRLHLDAVKEIAAMLSDAIQDAESDGTYTRNNIGPYRNTP